MQPEEGVAGAAVDYETHLLDFTEEESYTISPKRGDKLKIILDFGLEYNFDVSGFVSRSSLLLSYEAESYEIGYYEMGYFDLTGDEINDIVISFVDGASLKIVSLYSPVSVTPDDKFSPVLEKEKIKYPLVVPGLEIGLNLIFIFVLIALAVLIVFIYHHLKLKRLEKTQGKSVVKIYHTYRKSRKSKEDKIKMKGKLNKQLMLLVKAHKSGYVSKQSYLKGRARINDLIRKL